MSPGARLRGLLRDKGFVVTPGITTPLQAVLVERAGFDFTYVGGYDVSLTLLGMPDVGLMTQPEMLLNAGNIARAVSIPAIADADTGYGNAVNTMRTVREFEAAGLAGIHIEDQVFPKPGGHVGAQSTLVPLDEVTGKLRAALEARRDRDFVIIARTHAMSAEGGGLREAVKRGKAFAAAGCDVVWAEIPTAELHHASAFAEQVRMSYPNVWLYLDYSAAYKADFPAFARMGYNLMHVPLAGLRSTIRATWDYATALKSLGARAEADFQRRLAGHPLAQFHREGFAKIRELEARYLPAAQLAERYGPSAEH